MIVAFYLYNPQRNEETVEHSPQQYLTTLEKAKTSNNFNVARYIYSNNYQNHEHRNSRYLIEIYLTMY